MLFTISDILKTNQTALRETVYAGDGPEVRQFVISAGNFFDVCPETEMHKECKKMQPDGAKFVPGSIKMETNEIKPQPDAEKETCRARLEEIGKRLKELKNDEEDITHTHAREIRCLRQEKKKLAALLSEEAENAGEKQIIKFKNCLYAVSFETVKNYVPQLSKAQFRGIGRIPFFTKYLPELETVVAGKKPLAISGGPCLFGVNEVLVAVRLKNGDRLTCDFSSGRNFVEDHPDDNLAEALVIYGGQITSIDFINNKRGVTSQEYDSIHCLFEYARALGAKLAIPLPDMSYIRFFKYITEHLPETVADRAVEKFKAEAFKISDMYLAVIETMKEMYPEVEIRTVHERDEKMCRLFYEKRAQFLTPSVIRRLTAVRGKTDAVLDYITMPALPYYIWGITDVIQMDSLDETDSYRKCSKIHKGRMKLYGMMYPERISGDGENTIFYAPLAYKEYIRG